MLPHAQHHLCSRAHTQLPWGIFLLMGNESTIHPLTQRTYMRQSPWIQSFLVPWQDGKGLPCGLARCLWASSSLVFPDPLSPMMPHQTTMRCFSSPLPISLPTTLPQGAHRGSPCVGRCTPWRKCRLVTDLGQRPLLSCLLPIIHSRCIGPIDVSMDKRIYCTSLMS